MTTNKKVLVGGCFDLIHFGHLQFLEKARALGDYLVVALEPDEFIRKHKQREPIHTQSQRASILKALRVVDEVIELPLLTYDKYFELVRVVRPQLIAVTEGDPQLANKQQQALSIGAKVIEVTPIIKNLSTKKIIAKLGE
jgi:FAD synthetase